LGYVYFQEIGNTPIGRQLVFAILAVVSALAVVDAVTTRVVLTDTELRFRRGFLERAYPRACILKARLGFANVSAYAESEGWVRLPVVGSARSLAESLDHWIFRADVA
jgi:hypothetical protein